MQKSALLILRGGGRDTEPAKLSTKTKTKKKKKKSLKTKRKIIAETSSPVHVIRSSSSIIDDVFMILKTTFNNLTSLFNSSLKQFFDLIFGVEKQKKDLMAGNAATMNSSKRNKKIKKIKSSTEKNTSSNNSKSSSSSSSTNNVKKPIIKKSNTQSKSSTHRIQSELKSFLKDAPSNLSIQTSSKNIRIWIITLTLPSNTIYANEKYRLKITFPLQYPTIPPSVYFLQPTPRHEHVYTNGDICLSLLGKDWRPTMTAQSVALAIFSILCGAREKSLPMDNAKQAGMKPGQAQDDWIYHDDNC